MDNRHEFSHWRGHFKYSPLCQDCIVYCGQLDVYQQASELVEELAGIQVSDSTIQRMCIYYGDLLGDRLYDEAGRKAALSDLTNSEEASEQIKATSVSC